MPWQLGTFEALCSFPFRRFLLFSCMIVSSFKSSTLMLPDSATRLPCPTFVYDVFIHYYLTIVSYTILTKCMNINPPTSPPLPQKKKKKKKKTW